MAQGERIVFMGTSAFAAIILAALHKAGKNVVSVYTQPDRAAGRGMKVRESKVKTLALDYNLPVMQPINFKDDAAVAALAEFEPDFLIVAAYGLILPQKVLDIPKIAPINIHGSLLPAYRGAAPIQRAIMENWDDGAKTGVCIMRMEKGMDTGPVYACEPVSIGKHNASQLSDILARTGAELLLQVLPKIAAGTLAPAPQNEQQATYAAKLTKEDGKIDWHWPASRIDALIRGVCGWPGAHTTLMFGDKRIPVIMDQGAILGHADAEPGTVRISKNGILIACGDNWYELGDLRPLDRSKMSAKAFANGLRLPNNTLGQAV